MAYKTYITDALVCGAQASNTSDRLFLLFTRDAGMVYAHARSVREERSKHRFSLQPFSHIRVTLVRGKGGWKITGTEPIQNFFSETATREARAFLRNTVLLLRRVMQGETPHAEVFDDVIVASRSIQKYNAQKLEHVLFLRILHALGYVSPLPSYEALLHADNPLDSIENLSPEIETTCKEVVEYALTQSQL